MRRSGPLFPLALALLLSPQSRCAAQPPPCAWEEPPALTGPPPGSALSPWSLDVMLGLPTGLRAQYVLDEREGRATLVEGFAGLEAIFPIVGGGLRERFTLYHRRESALTFSPGVGAYGLYNIFHSSGGWFGGGPTWAPMVTADMDLAWRRPCREGTERVFGLKLGVGALRGGDNWSVIPFVGLFGGWRF